MQKPGGQNHAGHLWPENPDIALMDALQERWLELIVFEHKILFYWSKKELFDKVPRLFVQSQQTTNRADYE